MIVNQETINFVIGIALACCGWVFRVLWESVRELQKDNRNLSEKIIEVEKLVAGDYVEKSYFESKIDALFSRLDAIRDRLDQKADR